MENSKCGTIPMQENLKLSKSQGASTPAEIQRMKISYMLRLFDQLCDDHWTAVKNILKYLCNTKDMFLIYRVAVWIRKFISGFGVVPTIEEPINMYYDNTGAIAIAKDHGVTKGVRHFRAKVHCLRETIEMGDVKIDKVDTDDNLADPFTKALAFPKHSGLTEKIRMIPASSLMFFFGTAICGYMAPSPEGVASPHNQVGSSPEGNGTLPFTHAGGNPYRPRQDSNMRPCLGG
ncbi:hypothetical protein Tco_0958664 [Tanacetum coccineum]